MSGAHWSPQPNTASLPADKPAMGSSCSCRLQGCVGEWHPSFLSLGLQEAAPFLGSKDLPDRPHSLAEVSQPTQT